jgi:hypothetical protein
MKKFMVLYMASPADFEKMMKSSTPGREAPRLLARAGDGVPVRV